MRPGPVPGQPEGLPGAAADVDEAATKDARVHEVGWPKWWWKRDAARVPEGRGREGSGGRGVVVAKADKTGEDADPVNGVAAVVIAEIRVDRWTWRSK